MKFDSAQQALFMQSVIGREPCRFCSDHLCQSFNEMADGDFVAKLAITRKFVPHLPGAINSRRLQ